MNSRKSIDLQEVGVHLQHFLELEALNVEHAADVDIAVGGLDDLDGGVDGLCSGDFYFMQSGRPSMALLWCIGLIWAVQSR